MPQEDEAVEKGKQEIEKIVKKVVDSSLKEWKYEVTLPDGYEIRKKESEKEGVHHGKEEAPETCPECGHDLTAHKNPKFCPECGAGELTYEE